jgi:hypothetical protein
MMSGNSIARSGKELIACAGLGGQYIKMYRCAY